MRTRSIGSLQVTVVGIGCNNFGRQLDADATREIVHAALDHGIAFFDTADSYGDPKTMSETVLGPILKPHRDRIVLATKFGRVIDETRRGAKASYVRAATEASLKRLQTDYIDLMQLHIPDPTTPIEETLGALGELIKEGKIREIGGSNFTAPELREMSDAAKAHGTPRFVSTQAEFSLLHREPVADLIAECVRSDIRFLPFRPLFNGLLTGKYRPGAPPPTEGRIGAKSAQAQAKILSTSNLATVAALTEYAEARGHTMLELAIGWVLGHDFVPSVIAGVSSPRQVASNAAAAAWELTSSEMAEVGELLEANACA
ncbi:MAG TPA: aldo/keto reductase [Caulobacteraceae bacterium]|nr:aldo/keto reductase [Caulobacteraceae bacterium]